MPMHLPSAVAGVFLLLGQLLGTLLAAKEFRRNHFDFTQWRALDPDYLKEEWDFRRQIRGLFLAEGFILGIGWLALAYSVIQMAWILSMRGTQRLTLCLSIAVFVSAGVLSEWFSFLFFWGTTAASDFITRRFELDDWIRNDIGVPQDGVGWRSVELNHIVFSGFMWNIASIIWVLMGLVMIFTYFAVRSWRVEDDTTFGGRWNALTLFLSLMCFLEFIAQLLRFEGLKYAGSVAMVYSAITRVFLLPAWIFSLGVIIRRVSLKNVQSELDPITSELALTEINGGNANNENFTIDDSEDNPPPVSPPAAAFESN